MASVRKLPRILAVTITLGSQAFLNACSKSQTIDLTQHTTLLPNRPLTFRASRQLQVVANTNDLCLEIASPDHLNYPPYNGEWGVRRADGVLVRIGAAMLHADNSADTLSAVGYSGNDCLRIGPSIHDSLHPPFVAARITATDSLNVSRISWRSWHHW